MPRASNAIARDESPYVRGDYHLGKKANSPNWYVFRYDPETRQVRAWTTGTDDLAAATISLDEKFLAANDQSHAFCPTCGQKVADGAKYALLQAIRDYKIEHAMKAPSWETIKARLSHVIRFVIEEKDEDMPCSLAVTKEFAEEFRAWLLPQPVTWRKGDGTLVQHDRTIASVEGSIRALRAALNHAEREGRIDTKPRFKSKSAAKISRPVEARASVEQIAKMLDYAGASRRRCGLLRFILAELGTAARPDALFDASISRDRHQLREREGLFDLNPYGREQTKKYRPIVPILEPLQLVIDSANEDGWLLHYYGRRITTIRNAWRTMIADLNLGTEIEDEHRRGREYGPYLLRRSISTLLRQGGVDPWDVEGLLGHRLAGTTEIYARDTIYRTAVERLQVIYADIEESLGYPLSSFACKLLASRAAAGEEADNEND